MKFRDHIFQKRRAASLNVIRHATINNRHSHYNNKQNPSLRHEMSMRSVSSPLSADPTDDHDDDRESHQDPDYPCEALESVKLTTIYECILCDAVQPSSKGGCDSSSTSCPEYPCNEQENTMRQDASHRTARRRVQEQPHICRPKDDRPARCE